MIVFCPNCGTQNPGVPGARATCTACQSVFEVPFEAGARPATAPTPPASFSGAGPNISGTVAVQTRRGVGGVNALAVVSLVAGIVCCIPLLSPALAVGCGLAALKQIDAAPTTERGRGLAIAGLILGALSGLMQLGTLIGALTTSHP